MDISYRLNNTQIEKSKKYKNPSILSKRGNILKKWEIQATFNGWNV